MVDHRDVANLQARNLRAKVDVASRKPVRLKGGLVRMLAAGTVVGLGLKRVRKCSPAS